MFICVCGQNCDTNVDNIHNTQWHGIISSAAGFNAHKRIQFGEIVTIMYIELHRIIVMIFYSYIFYHLLL